MNPPPPCLIKKCIKPFDDKWATHKMGKVNAYNDIQDYLGLSCINDNESICSIEDDASEVIHDLSNINRVEEASTTTKDALSNSVTIIASEQYFNGPANEFNDSERTIAISTISDTPKAFLVDISFEEPPITDVQFESVTEENIPKLHTQCGSSQQCKFQIRIPTIHQLVHRSRLTQESEMASKFDALMIDQSSKISRQT